MGILSNQTHLRRTGIAMAHTTSTENPGTISIDSKETPGRKLLNWIPCSAKNKSSGTSMSSYELKAMQEPVMINCDAPSQSIEEKISNGKSIIEDLSGKLIPVPKEEQTNMSCPPEPPRTNQNREEIDWVCKAGSGSGLFEPGQTHTMEHMIDNDNVPDFDQPFVLETDANDFGVGGALLQATETIESPLAYFSYHLK